MIRILAILLLALLVLGKTDGTLPVCNRQTITQALPPVIFAQQTIDGSGQPPVITRFFHNKLGIAGSEIARCYFNALDPVFIYQWLGIGGLVGFLYFFYKIIDGRQKIVIAYVLILPFLPFFDLPLLAVILSYKVFAIIGLALALAAAKL